MEEGRIAFKILTDNPTGKRVLGSPSRRWEDSIRIKIGASIRNSIDSAYDRIIQDLLVLRH